MQKYLQSAGGSNGPLIKGEHAPLDELEPVEVAYLKSDGDRSFALAVLVIDQLNKQIKLGSSSQTKGASSRYEKSLKNAIKTSLLDWSQRKLEEKIGSPRKNPIGFIKRLPAMYRLFIGAIRGGAHEIIRQPSRIKKYLAPQGLARLVAELASQGFKDSLAQEVEGHLLRLGYLQDAEARSRHARNLVAVAGLATIAAIALTFILYDNHGDRDLARAGAYIALSLFAAFLLRLNLALRSFIPLYQELKQAVDTLDLQNRRFRLLRFAITLFTNALNAATTLGLFAAYGVGIFLLSITGILRNGLDLAVLGALFLVFSSVMACAMEAWGLKNQNGPSPKGEMALEKLKHELAGKSSVAAVKNLCLDGVYSREPAMILAYYGLETLLFL